MTSRGRSFTTNIFKASTASSRILFRSKLPFLPSFSVSFSFLLFLPPLLLFKISPFFIPISQHKIRQQGSEVFAEDILATFFHLFPSNDKLPEYTDQRAKIVKLPLYQLPPDGNGLSFLCVSKVWSRNCSSVFFSPAIHFPSLSCPGPKEDNGGCSEKSIVKSGKHWDFDIW